jgi:hypothetical protein
MIDLKPADPVEGILISQLTAANQASLTMYRRAWAQPAEYLEASAPISRARRQSSKNGVNTD